MPQPISRPTTPATGPSNASAFTNTRFASDTQLSRVLSGGTLTVGAKGNAVKKLQQAFADMGFALANGVDGDFGSQTAKAVRNFQVNASKMFPQVKITGVVDAATLKALDELAPAPGQKGQTKNLPSPTYDGKPVRVVVLKDEHRTFLFDKSGKLQNIFMNAVGKPATQTDSGLKVVSGKLGEADANALGQRLWGGPVFGSRIVDLSWSDGSRSGEELHGTNAPRQLGEDVSHGCMRHDNKDIITLCDALKVGDKVAIVGGLKDRHLQSNPAGWIR